MSEWEYRYKGWSNVLDEIDLNEYGKHGWELVSAIRVPPLSPKVGPQWEYHFKRPIETKEPIPPEIEVRVEGIDYTGTGRIVLMGIIAGCFGTGLICLCVWIAKMIWNS